MTGPTVPLQCVAKAFHSTGSAISSIDQSQSVTPAAIAGGSTTGKPLPLSVAGGEAYNCSPDLSGRAGMAGSYQETYARAGSDPEGFWAEAAEALAWQRRWDRVLDDRRPPFYRWFAGGRLNTCQNAVDRHVDAGRGEQLAIIHDSPVTNTVRTLTFKELQDRVARFAGALRAQGVGYGDRVIIYLPMVPEALIAMLGCARIGAVHSVVFGGFAAHELAARIDDARPRLVVSASCGIEAGRVIAYKPLLDGAIAAAAHKPERCIILARPQARAELVPGRDLDWDECLDRAEAVGCAEVAATDPLYILYTSGTTGQPKGIVRDHGGHAVALHWSMKNVYDVEPGEVYWAASDVGWVVGHSYICYGPLLHGNTTIVYEGKPVGTPDPGAFWRVIAQHGVAALFTAPTAFRAIKKEDPNGAEIGKYDLARFRTLFLAGERCDPDTLHWAEEKLGAAGDRSLVADRDRLGDRRQLLGARAPAGQGGLADQGGAGL